MKLHDPGYPGPARRIVWWVIFLGLCAAAAVLLVVIL